MRGKKANVYQIILIVFPSKHSQNSLKTAKRFELLFM